MVPSLTGQGICGVVGSVCFSFDFMSTKQENPDSHKSVAANGILYWVYIFATLGYDFLSEYQKFTRLSFVAVLCFAFQLILQPNCHPYFLRLHKTGLEPSIKDRMSK